MIPTICYSLKGSKILWNGEPLTLRKEGSDDGLTNTNGRVWSNTGSVHYQNFPTFLRQKMPLYGTQDVNTNDANTLILRRKTMVYMFREDYWNPVDMNGWTLLSTGEYLSLHPNTVRLYSKEMEAGTYTIDNNSAMYLFDEDY